MDEIKLALENLNSALCALRDGTARTNEKEKALKAQQLKLDEQAETQKAKTLELDAREGKVKNIESIVEATQAAIALKEEARALMTDSEKLREKLDVDLKKFAKVKVDFEKEKADLKESNKNQVEALTQERKAFEDKLAAAKAMGAIVK